MGRQQDIQTIVARIGPVDCDRLLDAMRAEGWHVETVERIEHLLATINTGRHHAVVLACDEPDRLPKGPMRSLMSFQGSLSLFFLVPDRSAVLGCPALIGATSDQIHSIDAPPDELVNLLKNELRSAERQQPEYAFLCVDDDPEFLRSLEQFLPQRIEEAFPRFALEFEFSTCPHEALKIAGEIDGDRLAVVVSDQVMPGMKGVELLTRIKHTRPHCQRVLLTGHAGLDAAIQAINEGALDRYFTKPIVQSADFARSMQRLLREYHAKVSGDALRHRLMAQFEFIRVVSGAHSLASVLSAAAAFVHEQMEATGVALILLEGNEFRVRAVAGDLPSLPEGTVFAAEGSLAWWVLEHRQPVVAQSEADLPSDAQLARPVPMPQIIVPLIWGETALGVIGVAGRDDGRPFARDERMLMSFIADAAAVTIGGLRDREAIEQHYVNTMASLMETVEAKDNYTRGHTDRVMELAVRLATLAGLKGNQLTEVARAAALHDIGKIAVPEWVIDKPGELDAEELALMRMHCERGARIVRHLAFLDGARRIILCHHERYDGQGYPNGLEADEIPLGARILSIVDAYDAMTSDRPYREAMTVAVALAELEINAGKQFDPDLVALFLTIIQEPEPVAAGAASEQDTRGN
ncbi:MAG TPA: HD domain-containing phosphohydrolase [Phycisphaerae bacterium]|nr:HD domain-containing phosphohydrolase [Phycisphaerae bacterium]